MKVYGALLSPFVRKVVVALLEKDVAYELVAVSPGSSRPEFAEASPFGKIPALRDGDFTLADSSAILHYVEAKHPAPALIPADPQARGKAVWWEEFADTVLGAAALKVLFNRLVGPKIRKLPFDENVALQGEAELPAILDHLEAAVPENGWLAGDFSIGDIAVASALRSLRYVGHGPDAVVRPRTAAWYARVTSRPAWQAMELDEAVMAERLGIA
ncbi:MAG: glutathione S-transferase family protein [Novosphingobium sp.]